MILVGLPDCKSGAVWSSATNDWNLRESVRAEMRTKCPARLLEDRYDYRQTARTRQSSW